MKIALLIRPSIQKDALEEAWKNNIDYVQQVKPNVFMLEGPPSKIAAFQTVYNCKPVAIKPEHAIISYDEWHTANEEQINIQLAETGADRELDFNAEKEFEQRYNDYVESVKLQFEHGS